MRLQREQLAQRVGVHGLAARERRAEALRGGDQQHVLDGATGGDQALVADNLVWALFWLLQAATLLRIAATVPQWPGHALLAMASLLWAGVMLAWGFRYGSWYGRARADGKPG